MLNLAASDARRFEMERQVPDLVDLTVMAVESGMGLEGALRFVADRLEGPLAEQCRQASREAHQAPDPQTVWTSLCTRVGIEEFTNFVSAIRGADRAGTSVGAVLRQLADDLRHRRLQRAREEAGRLPTKLTFVNVVLVPCLVLELVAFMLLPGWLVFLLLVPALGVLVGRYLAQGRERQVDEADRQLSDALSRMAGGIRAGSAMEKALADVAGSAPSEVAAGLQRVSAELKSGAKPVEAFEILAERFGRREINLLVAGIRAHTDGSAGGSLADVLARAAGLIGERVRVRGEIRALTSQAQFSTYLLTGIPLALAGIARLVGIKLTWIAQDYHLSPVFPMIGILMIYGTQAGVHRLAGQLIGAIERYMP